MSIDGLGTHPLREFGVLVVEGLLQFVQDPLFVLREWQLLVPSNRPYPPR
jgi:hypothetical protein